MKRTGIKLLPVVMVIIMLVGMLASCAQQTPGASSAAPSVSAAASASASTAASEPTKQNKEPVTLKFTYWGSTQEKAAVEFAVKQFMAKNDWITVNAVHIPSDYDTKITTMVAANEAPDLGYLESATIAFTLAEQDKLVDLNTYLSKDNDVNPSKILPNVLYYWEPGKVAGIFGATECAVLYYNIDMFKKAGIEPPPTDITKAWTWDQFVDVAKKLTIDQNGKNASESGFDPTKISQFGVNISLWWAMWGPFVYGNGGDFISADGKTLALNSKESTDALQKVADLINVDHVMPSPVQAKSLPNTTQSLQTQKIAMAIDGQWINLDLSNAEGLNYDIGALPVMKNYKTVVVGGMNSIFASSKHPDESWELIKFLVNPEYSLDLQKGGLWMPIMKDWYTDPALLAKWAEGNKAHPAGFKGGVLDAMLNYGVITPTATVKNFNKIMDVINPALDQVWLGQKTAAAAIAEVQDKAQAQVNGRRPTQ